MFDFLKSKDAPPPEAKASAAAPVICAGQGRVAWSPRDAASLARMGYTGNPIAFRCVRMIAEAASALPLILEGNGERFQTHPVLSLIGRPNGAQTCAEFFEALYGQYLLSGNAYIEAVGHRDVPDELHVLRSDRMSVLPGADGWPVGYEYSVGGRKHRFHTSERRIICHLKSFHPQDDHYGLSPLQAAAQAMDVHNSASRWSKALLDNAARPSGAIVYSGVDDGSMMSPEQFDLLQQELEIHHQGARNAGRPMLLQGGLDWKPMGFSPSDMEFQKTKDAAAREIALAFGVPPMMLGIQGDATYANYQEANRALYRLTVLPMVSRLSAAVSDWVSDLSGERVMLRPDLDQVPALAAERESHWKRVGEATFLTDAEKRNLLGLPAGTQDD